jgi:CobQ-like glutamine amidotransferase family enzyme
MWGGGQDAQQLAIMSDLHNHKAEPLKQAHAKGAAFLGICGGYQLLGHGYTPHQGQRLQGLGLLDVDTIAGHNRHIGNVVATTSAQALALLGLEGLSTQLIGFENHSGQTTLGKLAVPLAHTTQGSGNNGQDGIEGACQGKVLGTYLHGPLLPKNPWLTDALLALAWAYATGCSVNDKANPFKQPLPQVQPWVNVAYQQASITARG